MQGSALGAASPVPDRKIVITEWQGQQQRCRDQGAKVKGQNPKVYDQRSQFECYEDADWPTLMLMRADLSVLDHYKIFQNLTLSLDKD